MKGDSDETVFFVFCPGTVELSSSPTTTRRSVSNACGRIIHCANKQSVKDGISLPVSAGLQAPQPCVPQTCTT